MATSKTARRFGIGSAAACALALATTAAAAQDTAPTLREPPPRFQEPEARQKPVERSRFAQPRHELGLSFSDESVWFTYRSPFDRGIGHFTASFFTNEDEDALWHFRFLRVGDPVADWPFDFGLGMGTYYVLLDTPDEEIPAITLSALGQYSIEAPYPMRLIADVSFAPDITTFNDGEGLVDFGLGLEVDLSDYVSGFLGYRFLEVEVEGVEDIELDQSLHLGVRLGF